MSLRAWSPSSDDSSALEEPDDQDDDGQDEQDVDEPPERWQRYPSKQPQHHQYDEYGPEHRRSPLRQRSARSAVRVLSA